MIGPAQTVFWTGQHIHGYSEITGDTAQWPIELWRPKPYSKSLRSRWTRARMVRNKLRNSR